jgi:hypothetical protein
MELTDRFFHHRPLMGGHAKLQRRRFRTSRGCAIILLSSSWPSLHAVNLEFWKSDVQIIGYRPSRVELGCAGHRTW